MLMCHVPASGSGMRHRRIEYAVNWCEFARCVGGELAVWGRPKRFYTSLSLAIKHNGPWAMTGIFNLRTPPSGNRHTPILHFMEHCQCPYHPRFADWFRDVQIIGSLATGCPCSYSPPFVDNAHALIAPNTSILPTDHETTGARS